MTVLRIEALEKENKALKKELLRLKSKKKTRIIQPELNLADGNNNEEFFETVATVIADIILNNNYNNLKEFLNKLKSM